MIRSPLLATWLRGRPASLLAGVVAGMLLVGAIGLAGGLDTNERADGDVEAAYQAGFAAGVTEGAAAQGAAQAPQPSGPRPTIRLLPEARSGQLLEVSEACFQSPVIGCEEIY